MNNVDYYEELKNIMKDAAKHGAECYIYNEPLGDWLWGAILTENNNVLYIQRDSFKWRGWTFTLKYQPSRENGSGCQCLDEPLSTVTYDEILRAEKEGLSFARKLGATLYRDGRIALTKMYRFEDMEAIQ